MQRLLIRVLLLVTPLLLHAQKSEIPKVTKADLSQLVHPIDTAAAAAVLYETGKMSFDVSSQYVNMTVMRRIKIYKKEGYDWAYKSFESYVGNSAEVVSATTYNLHEGEIVATKLDKESVIEEKLNRYFNAVKINMPAVKEGSIIEYHVEVKALVGTVPISWDFQSSIPVNHSEFTTVFPKFLLFTPSVRGQIRPLVTKEDFQRGQDAYVKTTQTALNIPALVPEPYINNLGNYTASVSYEFSGFENAYGYVTYFKNGWSDILSRVYFNPNFVGELKKTDYFKKDLAALIKPDMNEQQRMEAIFAFVKSRVAWNGQRGYLADKGVKAAYKSGLGNVGDINLMLVAMLNHAGLSASPVVLSTREQGIPVFTSASSYDYVVAAVENKSGKPLLLDATAEFSAPGVLPLRCLNWAGRILRADRSFDIVKMVPEAASRKNVALQCSLNEDGTIIGKVQRYTTAHRAMLFRDSQKAFSIDDFVSQLESELRGIEIENYKREDIEAEFRPLKESWDFIDRTSCELISGKIYMDPLLFLTESDNPFKSAERKLPIDFGFPLEDRFNITISLPEGYKIESIPETVNFVAENRIGSFKYLLAENGRTLQLSISSSLDKAVVPAEDYLILQTLFKSMIEKQKERVVIIKEKI